MIKKIVEFALNKPLFVILATVLFIGGGVIAFKQLPVEAFPDVTDTQVTVITLFPGRAAEEVERLLGSTTGEQRDHRDLRISNVRESLHRQLLEGDHAAADEQHRGKDY